jgi:hypothetical protein
MRGVISMAAMKAACRYRAGSAAAIGGRNLANGTTETDHGCSGNPRASAVG